MTRPLLPPIAFGLMGLASLAVAESAPVVVELFTSQGCSSCPPADAVLRQLAGMEGVIPLALHVDYWDYIGWEDSFGNAAFTARQQGYAVAAGERTVYTPQFVVGGRDAVVGADGMQVMGLIEAHAEAVSTVRLTVTEVAGGVSIEAERIGGAEPLVVQIVRFLPEATVDILSGENAGHRLDYVNIVTDWQVIGRWAGSEPLSLTAPHDGDAPVVVILQAEGPGPIRAAARLD